MSQAWPIRWVKICGHLRLAPPVAATLRDTVHGTDACWLHGQWVCVACRVPMVSRSEHWAAEGKKCTTPGAP